MGEQVQWSKDLIARVNIQTSKDSPCISILDTGVNIGHPLLRPFVAPNSTFVIDPNWGTSDSNGHGTSMAGLAIWGDLSHALDGDFSIDVKHQVESIKLLRQPGDNKDKHLGQITATGVALSEIQNYSKNRIYALALSAKDSMDRGKPSAWYSELDSLSVDYLGDNLYPRLFFVSAGNTGEDLSALKE